MPHIRIVDDLPPEDEAMLQALYSRSAASVDVHLEKVAKTGSSKFLQNYLVGYGHKSIADCGTTTLFIEGVSTLAAKAIQDWPLYNGQETSTRYIDMGSQPICDPVGTPESKAILDRWMAFYREHQERVALHVSQTHPKRDDEDPKVYARAVKARTFDIMRGFLPAGITTQLSWHTNLRQAADHLPTLLHHPSSEIRGIGEQIRQALAERYSSSGFGPSESPQDLWHQKVAEQTYPDFDPSVYRNLRASKMGSKPELWLARSGIENQEQVEAFLAERPRGGLVPHWLTDHGQLQFGFNLDFGSFRDIQRHRNGVCRMPLLTTDYGFEPWYFEQMAPELAGQARKLVEEQTKAILALDTSPTHRQYYMGLGFLVPVLLTYGLPATIYVLELRSGRMVHPTLRRRVHAMVEWFRNKFPKIPIYADMDPDDWDIRRGTQTITEKT